MHDLTPAMLPIPSENENATTVLAKMPALITTRVEPVGRWYEAYCSRRRHKHTSSHHSLNSSSSEESTADLSEEEEENEALLMGLDPREWKSQDHYAVLGLSKLRYKATDDKLKRAYKKKVLKHHPDKRKARGLAVKEGDDDYFTCITRAYETLGNPTKRRSYDSVDPQFDDDIPSANAESKKNFFEVFGHVFERNARWSNKKNVPMLGHADSSYEDVNHFYSFWYDFDSWREYSYLDEEEKEKGENREERRWIEKQNKAARQKRKKEEIARIRLLVDNAYSCDPRIAKFKEEEKAKKAAVKAAKKEAARLKAEEEERKRQEILEAERKKKEEEEEEARAQAAVAKKEKEAQKKALKKEKKTLRNCLKDFEYFSNDDAEKVNNMAEMDKLAELLSLTSLQTLNESLTCGDKGKAKTAFLSQVKEMNDELEREKREQMELAQRPGGGSASSGSSAKAQWSEMETQLLIKGVNLFPAGTVQRWETVASFIQQHVPTSKRSAKEVLAKAKEMQKMDPNMKEQVNKKAFDMFRKDHHSAASADKAQISERYISVAEQLVAETGSNPAPWTTEEQKLLEQALRTYPASTPGRWDKVAEVLPSRSKKDCMKRYKELVELVQAKKAAQAAAAKKK